MYFIKNGKRKSSKTETWIEQVRFDIFWIRFKASNDKLDSDIFFELLILGRRTLKIK